MDILQTQPLDAQGGVTLNLADPCTQAQFGALVGVTQQAVSDMVARGVLVAGAPLGEWLPAYCLHLRNTAAGRGGDSDLAHERAELTRVTRKRAEIKLALERSEYAPVAAIEEVLAHVGRSVAGHLEPLPGQIHKLCPALTPEDVRRIQLTVVQACDVAVSASLALLERADAEVEEGGQGAEEGDELQDEALEDEGGEVLA